METPISAGHRIQIIQRATMIRERPSRAAATYSNPCALRLLRASTRIRTTLRYLTATRTVPIVCIQKARSSRPLALRLYAFSVVAVVSATRLS